MAPSKLGQALAATLAAILVLGAILSGSYAAWTAANSNLSTFTTGDTAETVNATCLADGASSSAVSCGSVNLLPTAGATSSPSVVNSGTLPSTYTVSALHCGAVTVTDSASDVTLAHGGLSSTSYRQSGPLSGYAVAFTSSGWLSTATTSTGPQTYTQLAWFKTTASTGAPILSLANAINPASATNTDRFLWVDPTGHLVAGVYNSGYREAVGTSVVNDGSWHLAAATFSSAGVKLYVDGSVQATNSSISSAATYSSAWWSVAAGNLSGWPDSPTAGSNGVSFFTGSLAGVGIVPTALSASAISSLYSSATMSAYATAVAADSPTDYWGLQDSAPTASGASTATLTGQSSVEPDLSGNAIDASSYGGVSTNSSGPISAGASLQFDGSSGYLETASGLTPSATYTELAWFKTSSNLGGGLVGFQTATVPTGSTYSSHDRMIWLSDSGHVYAGGDSGTEVGSASTYNNGSWHLAAATVSSSGLMLYVDGTLVASNGAVTSATVFTGSWTIGAAELGNWTNAPTLTSNGVGYFTGALAGVGTLPTALSATQIAALYASASFTAYTGPVIDDGAVEYWSLIAASNACSAATVSVSLTVGGVTTCLVPVRAAGAACSAASPSSLPLLDLITVPLASPTTAAAGQTSTLSFSVADNGTVPSALSGLDVLLDISITTSASGWHTAAQYLVSQTQL